MRGPDNFTESLFSVKKLDEFVPASHPLRLIRELVNDALVRMNPLFVQMYEPAHKGGRPSIAPEKLLRASLLQIFYSIRSERMLMEQMQYNLLFRWFVGLAMDDSVWVPTVYSKNRERMLEHDTVVALFNEIVDLADARGYLSGEHFSVDGTLIKAWAGHKSFRAKDGSDADGDGSDFKGKKRSNETHQSKSDPDSRLYRKGNTASNLSYMGHNLMDNRHGLCVNVQTTQATGTAECEAALVMIKESHAAHPDPSKASITLGADKGFDTAALVQELQASGITPHIAQNTSNRKSAVPQEIATTEGYKISQTKRKLIEQGFGWSKQIGSLARIMVRGLKRVDMQMCLNMVAYNLTRMRTLARNAAQQAENEIRELMHNVTPTGQVRPKTAIA